LAILPQYPLKPYTMEVFKNTVVLTRRFERYGGDSMYTLALVVDTKGIAYLYHNDDNVMKSITSSPKYVNWLLYNSMDLLLMAEESDFNECYCDWWSEEGDRSDDTQRRKEFRAILNSF
jgi:hypothetical protein